MKHSLSASHLKFQANNFYPYLYPRGQGPGLIPSGILRTKFRTQQGKGTQAAFVGWRQLMIQHFAPVLEPLSFTSVTS